MKRELNDILACPMCKSYPLDLVVFQEIFEVEQGVLICPGCGRFYPIVDGIPEMLPDCLRDFTVDCGFLERWAGELPVDSKRKVMKTLEAKLPLPK